MPAYTLNKVLSLGTIFAIIGISYLALGYGPAQWQFILLAIVTFGYAHFLVGFYYQWKSFARRSDKVVQQVAFVVLSLFAVALTLAMQHVFSPAFALYVSLVYFMVHGFLNEQTLLYRQSGVYVPLLFFLGFALFVMSIFNASVLHESAFFSTFLTYDVSAFANFPALLNQIIGVELILVTMISGIVLGMLVLCLAMYRFAHYSLGYAFLSACVFGSWLLYMFGPFPYIYVYFVIVGYHFMTWFVFYFTTMRARGKDPLKQFMYAHVIVLVPLGLLVTTFYTNSFHEISSQLLRFDVYVIITMVHITTSFMNDEWLQKIIARVAPSVTS